MEQTIDCPGCGAKIDYPGGGEQSIRCQYCNSVIPVPEELWRAEQSAKAVRKWSLYFVIFIVIVFLCPACVGIIGSLVGVGGTVFASLLHLFIH